MLSLFRNLGRLYIIIRVLLRCDAVALFVPPALPWLKRLLHRLAQREGRDRRPGQKLAEALHALGPTFIKFGQALSTRPDLLGDEAAADLSELQDRLPPFAASQARAIIAAELGAPIEELYQSFEDQPVAAASIAQVHFAVLPDGSDVAVKVLRPGVEEQFAADIALFYWLAGWAERLLPHLRRLRFVESVKAFEDSVILEMDLRFEAAAAAEMADNFADDEDFHIPAIDWQRTARRVLTLERVHGVPIDELATLQAKGIDTDVVMERAARTFFHMVFRDGFFHADMHPGNLFVDDQGRLIAVDFGITGRIDAQTRRFLGEMLLGFLNGNYRRVAEVHFEAGFVPADQSLDAFTQACRSIAEPIFGKPLQDISIARLLGQLFQITETFAMETQPQLLLLQKSMLVAEGVGRHLNPDLNMWQLARPLIEDWMRTNLGPQARIKAGVLAAAHAIETLPRLLRHAEQAIGQLQKGGLRLDHRSLNGMGGGRSSLFPAWLPWVLVALLAYKVWHPSL